MLSPNSTTGRNNPFAWYAEVEELPTSKNPGKRWTLWMNGGGASREDVAKFVREHFPHVQAITIEQATSLPTRPVQRVPPYFYEWGVRRKALGLPEDDDEPQSQQKLIIPLARKPISLRPLV